MGNRRVSRDRVNNVEMVEVYGEGNYTLIVKARKLLQGPQSYALVVTGNATMIPIVPGFVVPPEVPATAELDGFVGPFVEMGISGNNDLEMFADLSPQECADECSARLDC